MAFNDQRFTRHTLAFNSGRVTVDGPAFTNGPAIFSYASATDAIATVTAANYFASAVYDLAVGDIIIIEASDANGMYYVDAVNQTAGTVTVVTFGPVGSVGTANLQNGAVTAIKLANDAVETAKILNANVTLAKLASGIAPSHIVKYAGTSVYAGGGTSVAITVTGAAATDLVFAQIQASTNAVSVVKVVPTLNTVTVHFSADPGAATTVQYQVLRAAS
tara:strand:+ start:1531 stop:2187 length:657 start_codon:yes stop_codon:yes gene_type:complete